jgi:hypothetical protein
MSEEHTKGLDHAKIMKHGSRIFSLLTKVIMCQERSKEMTCGAVIATANLLVIMIKCLISDKDRALDVLTTVISKALKDYEEKQNEDTGGIAVIVCEISPDTETPGE